MRRYKPLEFDLSAGNCLQGEEGTLY